MLKMLIVPLVFFSITNGVCKMGDAKQLRTVGLRFVLYIVVTSGICSAIGIAAATVFNLGSGTTEFLDPSAQVDSVSYNFIDNVISWFPENIVDAMVNANMLQIIVFSLFLGATMKEVISFLIADNVCAIVILFAGYPLMIQAMTKLSGVRFMKNIIEPMIVAISTTSSAATLPVSIRTAEDKLGVPENIYGFTLPLGNTCGMNGFALFIGLFCIFSSHLYGFAITPSRILQFVFLGIILSIGAAGVKGAGVVMSTVLLESLGMPLTMVPILAAIWPVIDPAHTVLNNVSDLTGTTIIASQLKKLDRSVFNAAAEKGAQ